jgi:hypothetical protein
MRLLDLRVCAVPIISRKQVKVGERILGPQITTDEAERSSQSRSILIGGSDRGWLPGGGKIGMWGAKKFRH